MTKQEYEIKIRDLLKTYCQEFHDFSYKKGDFIKLHEPTFGADEIMSVVETMLSTNVTMGSKVISFEKEFCEKYDYGYGAVSNSGSSANLLALSVITNPAFSGELKPGDEVIVPALSWSTTIWPIIQHGLVPVFVDCDIETLNIDETKLKEALSPKTKAIMPIHVYGNPCNMDYIVPFCEENNLILIEDCCEALGARYRDKAVGSFGLMGTFSFYFSHHMATVEGGITVTKDFEVSELLRILRCHGWTRDMENPGKYAKDYPEFDPRFLFVNLGYNLRPTEMQGAMGSIQLRKLESFIDSRRKNAQRFCEELSKYEKFFSIQKEEKYGKHTWFGFPVVLKEAFPKTVDEVRVILKEKNIETRPIICGNITRQPAMKYFDHRVSGDLKNADMIMDRGFSFGNHQFMNDEAVDYIISVFDEIFRCISS